MLWNITPKVFIAVMSQSMMRLCIHYSAALSQTVLTWGAIRALSPVPAAASHLFSLKSGLRIITVIGSGLPTVFSVCVCVVCVR